MDCNKKYWYWLCSTQGIGFAKTKELLKQFQTPKKVFEADEKELCKVTLLNRTDRKNLLDEKRKNMLVPEYDKLEKQGIYLITKEEKEYPERLLQIPYAPYLLYGKGKIQGKYQPSIAIVGGRVCSEYGKEIAFSFAKILAEAGLCVISGMAAGIDSAAHRGALERGKTVAVLGCGIDQVYPQENFFLYLQIQHSGGILSEYQPGTIPRAGNFPARNRIISGLADAILVIEAKEKSGSFITVDYGLEQGKEIYAIPGRIDEPFSRGSNRLIKMGAKLVTEPSDILEDFYIHTKREFDYLKKKKIVLERKEEIVYASLSLELKHIEQIKKEVEMNIGDLLSILYNLESKGYIKQPIKNYYRMVLEGS